MNIKTKKTIAKEIIYFFITSALFFILWIGVLINNRIYESKINRFKKETLDFQSQIQKNNKLLNKKPVEFDEYGIPIKFTRPDGVVVSKNKQSNNNLTEKELLLAKNQKLTKLKTISNQNLLKAKNSFLNENQINNILFYSFIILFGLLYPIRLIFLLLKWSINTLK
jgi:hypothetical protein